MKNKQKEMEKCSTLKYCIKHITPEENLTHTGKNNPNCTDYADLKGGNYSSQMGSTILL